jgi:hypothetical protein
LFAKVTERRLKVKLTKATGLEHEKVRKRNTKKTIMIMIRMQIVAGLGQVEEFSQRTDCVCIRLVADVSAVEREREREREKEGLMMIEDDKE